MAINAIAGKVGFVKVGSVPYCFTKWKASMKVNPLKVTNFCSEGYQELIDGIKSATITLSGAYDEGNMPLTVGTQYTFILGWDTGIELSIDALVTDITPTVNANDEADQIEVTAESSGSFDAVIG